MMTMMKRLLSANLFSFAFIGVVVNANSHLPRAIQFKITKDDVSVTPVDYGGNHPFEKTNRRKLEDFDLSDIPNEMNRDGYEPLRIKYITDPIKASPNYSSNFDSTLEEILTINSETWSKHLSVFPVASVVPISREDCFGFYEDYIPASLFEWGVEDADMVIYVGEGESIVIENDDGQVEALCDEQQVLAFAFPCSIDQIDRPVIGAINYCINNNERRRRQLLEVMPLEEGELDLSIVEGNPPVQKVVEGNTPFADLAHVTVHEVAHALGFMFELFKYFRDPLTGEPLTPRPFQPRQVICVDGSVQTLPFPSTNTVDVGTTFDGRYYHEVVTPRVTQVARNHFDCQSLSGARLENQPTSTECAESHWDERLFLSELMGPVFSGYTDTLSPLTLALFDDSGWYKVSYDGAPNSPFGKGRGCDFVNQPCIVNDAVPEYGRDAFCDTQTLLDSTGISFQELVCDPTHKAVTVCDLFDINDLPAEIQSLIPEDRVQYFSDSNLVSTFSQADFCPLADFPYLDCTNQIDRPDVQTYQGEVRGPTSRCVNGQTSGGPVIAGCFEIECSATQHKVIIAGQTCDFDGQELSVTTMDSQSAVIECPYLATICPDLFCPAECSGVGECDYTVVPPVCRCFDDQDTSASCNMTESITQTQPPSSGAPTIMPSSSSTSESITRPPSSGTPSPSTSDAPQRMLLSSLLVTIPLALFGLNELWYW